jgi:amino acid transporter
VAAIDERVRPLGFASLLALGINGIVGVGIFFAPSQVAGSVPGAAGSAVYVATALALLPVAWAFAVLGGRFDVDGGPYVWARAAFGETFAFFVGWMAYVSALFSTSAVFSGLGQHAAPALGIDGEGARRAFAVVSALVFSGVAATGLRPSAIAWNVVTVLKLIPLVALAVLGITADVASAEPPQGHHAVHFARAALVVVFALQGFEIVPVVSGSARRSTRSIPAATVLSLLLAAGLYALLHAVAVAAVPDLNESGAPLVDAARALGGNGAAAVVAAGANVSAAGIAFGMIVMTPRYLAVLGEPAALGRWISAEDGRRVPQRALWLTAAVVVAFVSLGKLGELFVLSSVAVLAQYAVSVASLAVLAARRVRGLGRRHLWPAPLAIGALALATQGAEWRELGTAAGVLGFGALLLLVRRRTAKAPGTQ